MNQDIGSEKEDDTEELIDKAEELCSDLTKVCRQILLLQAEEDLKDLPTNLTRSEAIQEMQRGDELMLKR